MKRRNFLAMAATALAGLAIDPEKLLWTPGAKKIFIPQLRKHIGEVIHCGQGKNALDMILFNIEGASLTAKMNPFFTIDTREMISGLPYDVFIANDRVEFEPWKSKLSRI